MSSVTVGGVVDCDEVGAKVVGAEVHLRWLRRCCRAPSWWAAMQFVRQVVPAPVNRYSGHCMVSGVPTSSLQAQIGMSMSGMTLK